MKKKFGRGEKNYGRNIKNYISLRLFDIRDFFMWYFSNILELIRCYYDMKMLL